MLADDITLIRTPGHTNEDISTVVRTEAGLIVCTHAWWFEGGPDEDPYAPDQEVLIRSRERILALEPALVVPGHGPAFSPDPVSLSVQLWPVRRRPSGPHLHTQRG